MSTIGEKKNALRARTMQRYYLQLVKNGFAALWVDWRTRALLVLATFSTFMLGLFISAQHTILWPLYLFDCLAGYTLLLCAAFILTSRIPNSSRIIDNLLRIGIVNYAYEVPLPIQYTKRENNICELVFFERGLTLTDWQDWRGKLETALDIVILDILPSDRPSEIRIQYVPGTAAYPEICEWDGSCSQEDFVLQLGLDAAGRTVTIDLTKSPHMLICGATGLGKSKLAQLLVAQMLRKGAHLIIADWKEGLDYPSSLRQGCTLVTDEDSFLQQLEYMHSLMDERSKLFLTAGVANISEYNKVSSSPLPRCILLVDEASIILDATGRSKAEKDTIAKILNLLTNLGRKSRSYGLHLIICTQRADTLSIPGSLKAQLDCRISAHAADDQSSIVIMGDGSAADLPSVKGRFIMRDLSGSNTVFQAFLIGDQYLR